MRAGFNYLFSLAALAGFMMLSVASVSSQSKIEYKEKNFVVLAVAVKDRKQDAIDFVKELKITYPIALDPEAQVGSLYGAWGLPATYLIGPNGEGLARGWGPAEWYGSGAR